jgi:hypothetical protein
MFYCDVNFKEVNLILFLSRNYLHLNDFLAAAQFRFIANYMKLSKINQHI